MITSTDLMMWIDVSIFVAGDDKRYAQLKDEGCDWDQLKK
jgi:hypothetical protein